MTGPPLTDAELIAAGIMTSPSDNLLERVSAILKRQRANRYAEEAIAPSNLIDEEDAREIISAILMETENVR